MADEYTAGSAPFQDQVHLRAFVFDFLSSHALMLREWSDRTEAILDTWPDQTPAQRKGAAVRAIESVRSTYPVYSQHKMLGQTRQPVG